MTNASSSSGHPVEAKPGEPSLAERAAFAHQSNTGLSTRISRSWNILKYYRKSQLAIRLANLVARKIPGLGNKTLPGTRTVDEFRGGKYRSPANAEFEKLADIRIANSYRPAETVRNHLGQGQVCVLNEAKPLRWRMEAGGSLLWQFQLHYHEYLLPLINSPADHGLIESTIQSWLDENHPSRPDSHVDAWHPYCISRRLPVWFCILAKGSVCEVLANAMLLSAFEQAAFLANNLEWDLRGNHLLENVRAVSLAGCYFGDQPEANDWRDLAKRIVSDQIKEQVLSWGEHFERCPMYHCQILGNFLETMLVSRSVDETMFDQLKPSSEKMLGFLGSVLHPDGEIPLFGDSCFGEAPSVQCLDQLAEAVGLESHSAAEKESIIIGPYWIHRDDGNAFIFDAGNAGADTLPAHAHADLLTIEASVGGQRLIVDSGLFNYEDDEMRWYCRSSLAHNTVCIDGQNQFDIWSKFRMGYRGWTSKLISGKEGSFEWASCSHNAYRRIGVQRVSRLVGAEPGQFWYCVDQLSESSAKAVSGFIHFSPETELIEAENGRYQVRIGAHQLALSFFGASDIKSSFGWYCPEFGLRRKNVVLEYVFSGKSPAGWLLWMANSAQNDDNALGDHATLTNQPQLTATTVKDEVRISVSGPEAGFEHNFLWNISR